MRKFATILVALITLGAATPAFADYLPSGDTQRDVVPSKDMVAKFLAGEGYVASRLELRKYSADPVEDLAAIATKRSQSKTVRARAIECLALYRDDARVGETLDQMLDKTSPRNALFSAVLMAYAQVHGADGAEKVADYLDAQNTQVRLSAVVALGRFGGRDGYESLLAHQKSEENPQILERISFYVQ